MTLPHMTQMWLTEVLQTTTPQGKGDSGLALRKPGFRVSDAFQRDWGVYDAYDDAVSRLWENNPPTGDGSSGHRAAQAGDSCTLDGKRGHLQMIDGELK